MNPNPSPGPPTVIGMPVRFEIRPLAALPWPHGLGKSEYPDLEWRMKRHLGAGYADREVHERALLRDPLYRMIAEEELGKLSWAADLLAAGVSPVWMSGSPGPGRCGSASAFRSTAG